MQSASYADGDAGRESPFSLGAGARGMGMGRAFVALSGDASASFWNPAATSRIDRANVTAFRTTLFLNTNYDCLGLSYPFADLGVFSFSLGRIGTDDIEGRDSDNLPTDNFSSSETRFGFSYARHLFYGFHGGLTVKILSHRIGEISGSGAGADLGLQYKYSRLPWLTIGASFVDLIQPRVKLISVEDKYATVSRFGAMGNKKIASNINIEAGFDVEKTAGRSAIFHAGVEAGFLERYFLRLGFDRNRPTFGGGLFYRSFNLDYAYENIEYLGDSHRISFSFSFGSSVSEKRRQRRASIVREERESWERALSHQADSLLNLADSLRNLEEYQDALANYQKVLGLNPESEHARIMSDSMINIIISEAIEGVADLKRKELISGRIGSALNDFNEGRVKSAISKYRLLLEIDPSNETIEDLLASAEQNLSAEISQRRETAIRLQNQGDNAGALAEWNRILSLDEGDAEAGTRINDLKGEMAGKELIADALELISNGRYSEAMDLLERARSLRPGDESIRSLMAEARAKSVPPTTIEDIKSNSEHWDLYLSGLESYQKSDYKMAIEIWTELERVYPNNADLRKNINQARDRLAAEDETKQE
ncbi:MAG: PorV/PorQ family protein [Candidatus Zixiibacteriota bacterium]|nr:MAG: PorV/PorQ family protein [candidate division Zixibacteria bacterium]